MESKKRQKSFGKLYDSSIANGMLDNAITLVGQLLKFFEDNLVNDFGLLVISGLFDLMSGIVSNMWETLKWDLIQRYLDLLVQWLDKINQRHKELVCQSKRVLLVRQGGYFDITQNIVKNTNGGDLSIDFRSGHYARSLTRKTGKSEVEVIRCQLQTIEKYCVMILTQCEKIGSVVGRNKVHTYNASNENEILCVIIKFMANVLNSTLGDVGELINDKFYCNLIKCLLKHMCHVLKYGIPVINDDRVELKDTKVELIFENVLNCATNIALQMDDLNCTESMAYSIYKQLNVLMNYFECFQLIVKKDIHEIWQKVKSVERENFLVGRYHRTVDGAISSRGSTQVSVDSKPPRARLFAANALIFASLNDDSTEKETATSHNTTMSYKCLSFGDPKKFVQSGMGMNQFVELQFEKVVHVSSIRACVQFKNKMDCNNTNGNRFEYYDKKTNEFGILETFDIGKCCYPKNNHIWLNNINIMTKRFRFITDNGMVTLLFVKID